MSYDLLRFSLLFRRFVTVKADDSVPPFFIESEFRTLHLFRAPPSLITNNQTQSTHPSGGSKPKPGGKTCGFCLGAANLPKAVACGYSEGAGFVRSNGTLPLAPVSPLLPVAPHAPLRRRPWAPSRCLLGRDPGAFVFVLSGSVAIPSTEAERAATWGRRALLDGVGEVYKGRRDRALGCVGLSPLQLGPSRPPLSATAEARRDGVGRRPKTPRDGVGERSPAPGDGPTCGFQSPEAEAMGTAG